MKIFVINLDKNTERLTKFDALMRQNKLAYVRIRAIYGKELSSTEKKKAANHFAWWCVKGYAMRDGELGAALSHQFIYRTMIEQGIELACIFEDDANPNGNLSEQIWRVEHFADVKRSQIFLLADHSAHKSAEWSIQRVNGGAFAEGYILTLPAALALLKDNYPVKTPADSWSYWSQNGIIDLYQTTPASCDQDWKDKGYCSDVTPDNTLVVDVRRMSTVGKAFWRFKRAVGLILAKMLY